jgi:hypothetical protein
MRLRSEVRKASVATPPLGVHKEQGNAKDPRFVQFYVQDGKGAFEQVKNPLRRRK